ncbi:hypothetical protein HK099_004901 [Clydaea vesicula]|uniref:TM7S3/TM198-like domain-containing protein n=1 Tax=Clydaea vesicula TaxID=447962 RepID=A0AAD5U1T5_9FUNG|nr:hypothetical protein HK099_004901 [Clydaea vesicula]
MMIAVPVTENNNGTNYLNPIETSQGLYVGACLAFVILTNLEPYICPETGYPTRDYVYLVTCVVFGVACGFLMRFFWKLGLAAIGAFGGFSLSIFILSLLSGGVIKEQLGRAIFILVLTILGAIAIVCLEKHLLIFSTSFGGAFSIIYGLDLFLNKGLNESITQFIGTTDISQVKEYKVSTEVYFELVGMLILYVFGTISQYKLNSKRPHREGKAA